MDSNLQALSSFLTSKAFERINIPIYQRSYDWKGSHVTQFLDDINYHLGNENSEYQFLGMIVYVNKENQSKEIEIIDGQQRLTTYYLLLSVVHDWLTYEGIRDFRLQEFTDRQKANIKTRAEKIRDVLYTSASVQDCYYAKKEEDSSFLETKLYTDNTYKEDKRMTEYLLMDYYKLDFEIKRKDKIGIKATNPLHVRQRLFFPAKKKKPIINMDVRTARSRPIAKNYKQISEWFEEKFVDLKRDARYEELKKLTTVLTEKLNIIPFKTETHSEAFTLFEVLNDRGLQVSQADLLKNLCIKKGETFASQKEMYDKWQDVIDDNLKEDNKIPFLRTSYNSKHDFIRKNELYAKYKSKIGEKDFEETCLYLDEELAVDVENYNLCLLLGGKQLSSRIQNSISLLYHTYTTQWRSIVLALLRSPLAGLEKEILVAEILDEVFEIVFTMVANETRFNEIETQFPEFAVKINKTNNLKSVLTEIKVFKNSSNFSYKHAVIDLKDLKENKFCTLLLMMFKSSYKELSTNKLTVEHVLPQKPKQKDWAGYFPKLFDENEKVVEKETESTIYSIGNMLLIEDKQNKSLSNFSFDVKKEKLEKLKFIDLFEQIPELKISNTDVWDHNTIKVRAEKIKSVLKSRFKGLSVK